MTGKQTNARLPLDEDAWQEVPGRDVSGWDTCFLFKLSSLLQQQPQRCGQRVSGIIWCSLRAG